jgi:signal transduction histidine kinase
VIVLTLQPSTEAQVVALGFYLGMVAATTVYNLFLFLSLRETAYLAFAIFASLVVASELGWLVGKGFAVPQSAVALAALAFITTFTGRPSSKHLFGPVAALSLLTMLEPTDVRFSGAGAMGLLATLGFGVALGARQARRGWSPGGYLALGLIPVIVAVLLGYASWANDLEHAPTSVWARRGCLALAAIVLALALAERVRLLRREQAKAQRQADTVERELLERQVQHAEEVRRLEHDLVADLFVAREQRRARLAAELHDGLGQDLLVASNALGRLTGDRAQLELFRSCGDEVQELVDDVRHFTRSLHPHQLQMLGLEAAVLSYADEVCRAHEGAVVEVEMDDVSELNENQQTHAYRLIQALLEWLLPGEGRRYASVNLRNVKGRYELRAFSAEAVDSGTEGGPQWMEIEERADALSGKVSLDRAHDGTEVLVQWPARALGSVAEELPLEGGGNRR